MKLPIAPVIDLLHRALHVTLATQSAQLPGYPYATVIPNVLDRHHQPLLLVSALAEHTKNLLADARASLTIVEAGATNVQDAARATLVGRIEPGQPGPALLRRYLRYQPDAEQYLALDFQFFRMTVERIRFIGGVGRMGWLDATAWQAAHVLAEDDEQRLLARAPATASLRLLGVDPFGIDYEAAGTRRRKRFDSPLSGEEISGLLGDLPPPIA